MIVLGPPPKPVYIPVCPFEGNETTCANCIYVTSQADLENNGNLTTCGSVFSGAFILNNATGNITIPTDLTSVWGIHLINNSNVQSLSLPSVGSLQSLQIQNATSLQFIDAPKLNYSAQLYLQGVPALETLNSPALMNTGDFRLSGVQSGISQFNLSIGYGELVLVDSCLPLISSNLVNATELGFTNLTGFSFPMLKNVSNDFTIYNSPNITTISLNALQNVSGSFIISGHPKLTDLQFNSLVTLADVTIDNNTALVSLGTWGALKNLRWLDLTGPFSSLASINSSFPNLQPGNDSRYNIELTSGSTPVSCTWNPMFGNLTSWESKFKCNNTRSSLASSLNMPGGNNLLMMAILWIFVSVLTFDWLSTT